MQTTDNPKNVVVKSAPVLIKVFSVLLVFGIVLGALRVWALSSIEGYEHIKFEFAVVLIMHVILLYGIFKRKPWTRITASVYCFLMAGFVLFSADIRNPSTYVVFIRDIPFAIYFLISKKAKVFFQAQKTPSEIALSED